MDWMEVLRSSVLNAGIGTIGATAAFIIAAALKHYF